MSIDAHALVEYSGNCPEWLTEINWEDNRKPDSASAISLEQSMLDTASGLMGSDTWKFTSRDLDFKRVKVAVN
ncbi:MAG: hypothetical protein E6J26_03280 [Chloroflexi bacterium]|nr:MAG: hypothetical protein E6J26_03280 [Chloroflexota bacterium]